MIQSDPAADELLRRAAEAPATFTLDIPDRRVVLPRTLELRGREVRLRGVGPASELALAWSGHEDAAVVSIRPPAGETLGAFSVERLGLTLVAALDGRHELAVARVEAADGAGLASGEFAHCRFAIECTQPLHEATVRLCRVGELEPNATAGHLRVRDVVIRDCLFEHSGGTALCLIHVHGCRALRNFIDGAARTDRDAPVAVDVVGAERCEVRDNVVRRRELAAPAVCVRIAGTTAVAAAHNTVRDNLFESASPAVALRLVGPARENAIERNRFACSAGDAVGVQLDPVSGPVRDNWIFDNRFTGFAVAVEIRPGDASGNRLVNSLAGRVDDAGPGRNLIVLRE